MNEQKTWDCKVALIDDKTISYTGLNEQECRVEIASDDLILALLERFNVWIAADVLSEREDLELVGRLLYSFLFPTGGEHHEQNLRNLFEIDYRSFSKHKSEHDRLRLTLEIHQNARKLSQLPWEFLFMPLKPRGFFLAGEKTELILTRFVPNVPADLKIKKEEPLRILVIFSHPCELPSIGSKLTLDIIQQISALETLKHIEVRVEENPTHSKVFELMNGETLTGDAAKPPEQRSLFQPDIIHFIGHGEPGKLALLRDPEHIQEDEDDGKGRVEASWCDSEAILQLFKKHTPRLVFLHACDGAKSTSVAGFSDLARDLVYARVPAVVAMQYTIKNRDAAIFAKTFYDELRRGRRIDEAVHAGRAILGRRQDKRAGWSDRRFGTPVVYFQSKSDLALIECEEPEAKPSPAPVGARRPIDPNVRMPCPNPRCDGFLTLDSIECVLCEHKVMTCPTCEGRGNHFLFSKTLGKCGRCGYRAPDIRTSAGSTESAGEAVQPEKGPVQPEDALSQLKPTSPASSVAAPGFASFAKGADHILRPDDRNGG